jgi:hypothetical protein
MTPTPKVSDEGNNAAACRICAIILLSLPWVVWSYPKDAHIFATPFALFCGVGRCVSVTTLPKKLSGLYTNLLFRNAG